MFKKIMVSTFATFLVGSTMLTGMVYANDDVNKKEIDDEKLNVSYIYDGDTDYMIQQVDETKGTLDIVLPSLLEVRSNGTLRVKEIDPRFIEEMHKRNIKVIPYITNHWVRSVGHAGMNNREQLSTDIANVIVKYNFDGIDVDIENLNDTHKQTQTEFMKLLREKLPADKLVTLAIAANPTDLDYGWHGSYDYQELEKYVDYFFLMTYDERTVGSGAGPTASYQFVEDSVKHLVEIEKVNPNKIVLGLPFYGRYWKYDGSEVGGQAITNSFVEVLRERQGGTKRWDDVYKTPYTILYFNEGKMLNGMTLTGGNYVFWYEDIQSLTYKTRLVTTYDLKGYGSWNLNMADDSQWETLDKWANGESYYLDTIGHPFEKEISYNAKKQWFSPLENESNFEPNDVLSKGEVAVILYKTKNLHPLTILYPQLSLFKQSDMVSVLLNSNVSLLPKFKVYNDAITQDQVVKLLGVYGYIIDVSKLDEDEAITKAEMAYILYQLEMNQENVKNTVLPNI